MGASNNTVVLTWLAFLKETRFSPNINYAKKHDRQNDTKRWFFGVSKIHYLCLLFSMPY